MTHRPSSPLAIVLLERLVPDSEALAGDLLEHFEHRPSIAWLWWQVAAAVATHLVDRPDDIRPLRLVDLQPADAIERSRTVSLRASHVNLTASPVNGVGGLTLVVLAALLTFVASDVWWVLLASIIAGTMLGVLLIARHRGRMSRQPPLVFDGLIPRHVSTLAVLVWLVPFSASGAAQTAPPAQDRPSRPVFEVTSVKPNSTGRRGGAIQPGRFAQSAVTLRQLAAWRMGRIRLSAATAGSIQSGSMSRAGGHSIWVDSSPVETARLRAST
jgi:hypothetical protein